MAIPHFFFVSGESTPKGAGSVSEKHYRAAFIEAGIKLDGQLSHTLRHTFAFQHFLATPVKQYYCFRL
jgi:hypothetical protein